MIVFSTANEPFVPQQAQNKLLFLMKKTPDRKSNITAISFTTSRTGRVV